MADRVGQQFGNYRLVALLGQGGFAEVYLGQHLRLNLQVALKVLHTHLTDQEAEHFQQEAETVATLMHPSIVRILDYDVQDGVPFLVMDYAPNGSLRRRYPKGTVVPLPQIVSHVRQVADALQYAHEQKFIHRDVKPENMLLGRREEVLLSDFGLAALSHSSGSLSTQEAIGTLSYMAPEQIEGHPRPASDQYALGVVVYEWLCGSCLCRSAGAGQPGSAASRCTGFSWVAHGGGAAREPLSRANRTGHLSGHAATAHGIRHVRRAGHSHDACTGPTIRTHRCCHAAAC